MCLKLEMGPIQFHSFFLSSYDNDDYVSFAQESVSDLRGEPLALILGLVLPSLLVRRC